MAAIGINVNKDGIWSVFLDKYEWTALKAEGNNVTKIHDEWNYSQPIKGDFKFVATAVGTKVVNSENQAWVIKQKNGVYYLLTLDYKPITSSNGTTGFVLTGRGATFGSEILSPSLNKVQFSQGNMKGVFSVEQG
ncbi:MAG: hypothetical protein JKY02_01265 [Flavobacteriaceae bacterium]|nr:hypothetical protein [Flavobacteriaceae bacterium]